MYVLGESREVNQTGSGTRIYLHVEEILIRVTVLFSFSHTNDSAD